MSPALALALALVSALALLLGALWLRDRRRVRALEAETRALRQEQAGSEGELRQARTDLEAARDARETFFDLVTHELRSPLSAILGYQELLADGAYGDLGTDMAEPVDRIGRSATHLLHLIDGVVELSRIRSGSVRLELGAVDLGVVLITVAEAFEVGARERRVEAHVSIPDSLPTIRSDQERLVRALDLLITSAVKHPGGPGVRLEVTLDDDIVTIRISGLEIGVREESDDPALRYGIRLAVAQGVATLLGGGLDLEHGDDGLIRVAVFRIRDLSNDAHVPARDAF